MKQVETVLGPVNADLLGATLSHEHLIASFGAENLHYPWRYDWTKTVDARVRDLRVAKAHGITTIIDLTTPDLGRDVEFVRRIAEGCEVHVIVATGLWRDIPRSFWNRDIDKIADVFAREIEVGIGATSIKAGVIKVANEEDGGTPIAERVLRGAARASNRTGCPISTHQFARGKVGRWQLDTFLSEGVHPNRICIGHSADTTDVEYLESLLKDGAYLSMDRYGPNGTPSWTERNTTVKALIERGWATKLMLGHDNSPAPLRYVDNLDAYDAETSRYVFLSRTAIPALIQSGVSQADVDTMLRAVPRQFLSGEL